MALRTIFYQDLAPTSLYRGPKRWQALCEMLLHLLAHFTVSASKHMPHVYFGEL